MITIELQKPLSPSYIQVSLSVALVHMVFENISKQYRLGLVSTGTLSHDLNRFWQTKVLRREGPYLKKEQGDVVGIIGRNGTIIGITVQ